MLRPAYLCYVSWPDRYILRLSQEHSIKTELNSSDLALTLGLKVLTFIISREPLAQALMTTSGVGADDIRNNAQNPEFLGAMLDFLLSREADLLEFCAAETYKPETLVRLRAEMPGGPADFWA